MSSSVLTEHRLDQAQEGSSCYKRSEGGCGRGRETSTHFKTTNMFAGCLHSWLSSTVEVGSPCPIKLERETYRREEGCQIQEGQFSLAPDWVEQRANQEKRAEENSMNPFDIPDEEEVESSGTADWVDSAVKHHRRKQQSLASAFGNESRELRQEKEQLADIFGSSSKQAPRWSDPAEDAPPDVFGNERKVNRSKQQSLSQVFGEAVEESQAEKQQLRNLFGAETSKKNKRR